MISLKIIQLTFLLWYNLDLRLPWNNLACSNIKKQGAGMPSTCINNG